MLAGEQDVRLERDFRFLFAQRCRILGQRGIRIGELIIKFSARFHLAVAA